MERETYVDNARRQFGVLIEDARQRAGYDSQEKFAQRIGVSQGTVSKWEQGVKLPDFARVDEIETVLHIPRGQLSAAWRSARVGASVAGTAVDVRPPEEPDYAALLRDLRGELYRALSRVAQLQSQLDGQR